MVAIFSGHLCMLHTATLLMLRQVADVVDVDAEPEAGDEGGGEGEVVFGQRPQTERRSSGWDCRFCPTTPGALRQHCRRLYTRTSFSVTNSQSAS